MTLPADDRGLLLGDGLFETLLARDGELVDFEPHVARLAAGCEVVGLPAPDTEVLRRAAEAALAERGLQSGRAAVRLTWTAGSGGRGVERADPPQPRLVVQAFPAPEWREPARLVTATVRRNEGSPASRLKTLSYMDSVLARREALAAGAEEAVMLNNRGEVACATVANLFWFEGERLMTPALSCGVLDGTMRRRVMSAATGLGLEVVEAAVQGESLAELGGLFLTNSLIGLRPVASLDGRAVEPNALTARLAEAVQS